MEINSEALEGLQKFESKPYTIIKKMSKGYNWEIKVLHNDINELEKLNNEMIIKFGSLEV